MTKINKVNPAPRVETRGFLEKKTSNTPLHPRFEKRGIMWCGVKVIIIVIIISLFTLYYSLIAKNTDLSFDGAIYSQGSVSLLKYGTYVNYLYNNEDLSKLRFRIYSQGMLSQYPINIPFILMLGINNLSLQINNIIFLVLSSFLLYYMVSKLTKKYLLGLLSIVLFFTFPGVTPSPLKANVTQTSLVSSTVITNSFALGGYGEIPAFFYLLLTISLLYKALENKRYYPVLGASLFLTFNTKFFLVLIFPILLVVLFFLWKFEKRITFKNILSVIIVCILPVIILNLVFLIGYGWDEFKNYYEGFWRQIISQQYGSNIKSDINVIEHMKKGMETLTVGYGNKLSFYGPLILGYMISIFATGLNTARNTHHKYLKFRPNLDSTQVIILCIFIVSATYIVWWFHLSTAHKWYRKILPVLILNIPLYAISIGYLYDKFSNKFNKKIFIHILSLLIFLPIIITHVGTFINTFELKLQEDKAPKDRKEIVDIISKIPLEEKIFGVGWWQAPRLSLFSGRPFFNIKQNHKYSNGYLVFNSEALRFAQKEVKRTLERYDVELIKKNDHFELYRWKERVSNR